MPPRPPTDRDPRSSGRSVARSFLVLSFAVLVGVLLVIAFVQTQGNTSGLPAPLDDGEVPEEPLSGLVGLGLFVGLPLLVLAGTAALVVLPDLVRGPSYRPARGWRGDAFWFAGPADAETAVREAAVGAGTRGGARGSW